MTERDEQYFKTQAEKYGIPEHMHGAIVRYIVHGIVPGNFLCAVISNNLSEAITFADDKNIKKLDAFVKYFYMEAPAQSHGSERDVERWIERGGLNGNPKTQAE